MHPTTEPRTGAAAGRALPEISVIVPCFNEVENLEPLVAEIHEVFDALGPPWELVLVDDGSDDGSWERLQALAAADPALVPVGLARRCGQSAALDTGFRHARGRRFVTLDADLQNDPHDAPRLLALLETGEAAMVSGRRAQRRDTARRRWASRVANTIRRAWLDDDIHDVGCSLKVYRREALARVKLYTGLHRFLAALVKLEGYRVAETAVHHRPRRHGTSKYNIRNRARVALEDLFAVRWMQRRALRYQVKTT